MVKNGPFQKVWCVHFDFETMIYVVKYLHGLVWPPDQHVIKKWYDELVTRSIWREVEKMNRFIFFAIDVG